ncbi:MAG: hypothetical protein WBA23_10780 [Tunicatimonas sp.]|uniref:hypothetical protein n=1 Tax=Tunicatimonas sp. TaxID=1940096 RepID=UPI003C75887D
MKKLSLLFVLILSTVVAFAQDDDSQQETLVKGFRVTSAGGYGGPSLRTSSIGGDFALFFGGYGGVFINKKWTFGGGGYGMITQLDVPPAAANGNLGRHYDMGYGGFLTEYTLRSDQMLHLTAHLLIGGGGISHDIEGEPDLEDTGSNFFVLEPGAGVELNITDFFRLNGGLTYRLVSGSDTAGITDGDLSSMAFFLNFKFGYFN